mmetsp:Transcript_50214/g.92763  ORF Transcript_50214/g.92763 Transcript_50214/m.92763 type:complete len:498 (+) Transcript_50214:51-1544(+)
MEKARLTEAKGCRVIVIGAGVAGLSAASLLQDAAAWEKERKRLRKASVDVKDVEVIVLEARGRIGGRVWTEHFQDDAKTSVDMGAAWLHGNGKSNPLVKIAQDCKARLYPTDWDNGVYFEAAGSAEKAQPAGQLSNAEMRRLEKLATNLWRLYEKHRKDRKKLQSATDESLQAALTSLQSKGLLGFGQFPGFDALSERDRALLETAVAEQTDHDYAATWAELSSTWWDADEDADGDHCLWKDGFVQVPSHLASGVRVELNAEVSKISYAPGMSAGDSAVTVECSDGRRYEADHCICTLPLGVLQHEHSAIFYPPLPEVKAEAIRRLGMGCMEKLAMRFETCFWDAKAQLIYRAPTCKARMAPTACESPFWVNLKPVVGSNVLVAYFCTDAGRETCKLTAEQLQDVTLDMLKSMYGSEAVNKGRLLEAKRSNWSTDKWSYGCYSFLALGSTPQDRGSLAEPCGNLHFAGEATDPTYPATVHGALLSGRRAAMEIIASL